MLGFRKRLALLIISSTLMACLFGISSSTPAQDSGSCTGINYVGFGCVTFKFVGVEQGKPFTAQRTVTSLGYPSDGTNKTAQWIEFVARDSSGRIRFEQSEAFKPPNVIDSIVMSNHEIEKNVIPGDAPGPLVAIFDCFNGESVVLQPRLQIAHVIQTCNPLRPVQQSGQPYSRPITMILSAKLSSNVLVEDLGYKKVEGIMARGIRSTVLGTDKDPEWNGRPIRVWESWMSDDLAATVLYVRSDFRKRTESRSSLTNIKRVEPDSALFAIPPDYKISNFTSQ
jgi:hypothetical protein